jgi:hypothetical protein
VGSPIYEARVLGQFPDAGEGVLFPLHLLEATVGREVPEPEDDAVTLGVDVARSIAGDLNAIAIARGGELVPPVTWHSADTMQVVERVIHEVAKRGPRLMRVDVGGPGAGVCDRLRQLGHSVEEVHFGGAPRDGKRFKNRRAELFWLLRERLERGDVSLPDDDHLIADLASIRYFFAADGRIQLEAKEEVRKRVGHSPDRADAVALAALVDQGLLFPELQDGLHLVEAGEPADWTAKEIAVHWGYGAGAHVLWIETSSGVGGPPRSWVYHELAVHEVPAPELAQLIAHQTPEDETIRKVTIRDYEAAWGSRQGGGPSPVEQMRPLFRTRRWSVVPAPTGPGAVRQGWTLLHTYFYPKRRGGPVLRVRRSCSILWHQLTTLVRGVPPRDIEDLAPGQSADAVHALRYWAQNRPQLGKPTEADLLAADPDQDKLEDPRSYEAAQIERLRKYGFPAVPVRRPPRRPRPKQQRRPW